MKIIDPGNLWWWLIIAAIATILWVYIDLEKKK